MKIIILALILAGVIGGGYYLMHSKGTAMPYTEEAQQGTQPAATTTAPAQGGKFSGSITDLATRGGSWQCTVDTSTAGTISSGTTYVSGKQVRADFDMKVQGYTAEAHMIADGTYVYSWSSMTPMGIKVKETAHSGSTQGATSGQGASASTAYNYDCQPWSPDASKFAPPSTVTFQAAN